MKGLRILHTADLHMDSPFEGLGAGKAAVRRGEQRDLLGRIAALAAAEQVDLVLFSGDLLDSDNTFYETGEELIRALRQIRVPVFIAPGNHDFYSERSPYARLKLPENIHIFTENEIRCVDCGELGFRVYGAAFTDRRSGPLLRGFHAERTEGVYNILCLHGEVGVRDSIYDPISEDELARSGVDYAALGHVHKASGLCLAGSTWYSWPGCPEGRGFDETGEKTLNLVEFEGGNCTLRPLSVASRRYETMEVDVSETEPLLAVHTLLPDETVRDVYRIVLKGETDAPPDLNRLYENLSEFFFELQLRDETRLRQSVWERSGDDSLRGLFLLKLRERYDAAKTDEERMHIEQAARWGLAAIDNREEVVRHDDQ